jgi:hypothetical protein
MHKSETIAVWKSSVTFVCVKEKRTYWIIVPQNHIPSSTISIFDPKLGQRCAYRDKLCCDGTIGRLELCHVKGLVTMFMTLCTTFSESQMLEKQRKLTQSFSFGGG